MCGLGKYFTRIAIVCPLLTSMVITKAVPSCYSERKDKYATELKNRELEIEQMALKSSNQQVCGGGGGA